MITVGRIVVVDYEDLIDEHVRIDALSRELEGLVGDPSPKPQQAQALLRELARVVADHLRKEEGFIYPGLAVSESSAASGLVLDFEALKQDWENYLHVWQQAGSRCDWQRFGVDTIDALQRLRERAMAEVGELYALGLREGLVTLRPASVDEDHFASARRKTA